MFLTQHFYLLKSEWKDRRNVTEENDNDKYGKVVLNLMDISYKQQQWRGEY